MDENTLTFLRRVYRGHYFKHHNLVEIPSQIQSREFGYIPFDGGMIRHLSFRNPGELVAELVKQAPSSVYCSNAVYERPTLQMDEKGWLGAELIFDIDADSIPTPCKVKHNWWFCNSCKKGGLGSNPSKCPRCRAPSPERMQWSCRECLNATKEHVRRLLDFMMTDFGVNEEKMQVYFSGNRGYHVHVRDERFLKADPPMRGEIANYIVGDGLSLRPTTTETKPENDASLGWRRRTDLMMKTAALSGTAKRQTQKLIEQIVRTNAALIDESVTTDVHRVFRMPGTLHGNSGLLKMPVQSIDGFDPQTDPIVLSGDDVRLHIDFSPEFSLNGIKFGPYDSTIEQIPIYAGVFLAARGLAQVLAI